jgi:peptidoglycan hydrolase FlgJ
MSSLSPLAAAQPPDSPFLTAARQKATELEGVFLNTLVSQMMSDLHTDNGFGGGDAEKTWRSIQSEYLADSIAKSGGIGLADDILRSLLQQQEAGPAPSGLPQSQGTTS